MNNNKLVERLDAHITSFDPQSPTDYQCILDKIGDARIVLIGEASHGTQEFYQVRAELSRQLIEKKGFMAVSIEGDWPDSYHIHRYIQGVEETGAFEQALSGFSRFPTWMWRNTATSDFIQWMRKYNTSLIDPTVKVGFYGLDLYSLQTSIQAVIDYLRQVDPKAAEKAYDRYGCFDDFINSGVKVSCAKKAAAQFLEIQHKALVYMQQDGFDAAEEYFYAAQNARLVKNAEEYYRTMYEGHIASWNVRDKHMAETLDVLSEHLENRFKKPAKIIVWAHNSHVGDARATEMGERGEWNLGQLVRERYNIDSYTIGFSTAQGFVTAASRWDGQAEQKKINMPIIGSYEDLFHQLKYKNFWLDLTIDDKLMQLLTIPRLQRAIGVIYSPETERDSHYFLTRLPYQFDSIIHLDQTSALKVL